MLLLDTPAVLRSEREGLENQQVGRALQVLRLGHSVSSRVAAEDYAGAMNM